MELISNFDDSGMISTVATPEGKSRFSRAIPGSK